MIKILFSLLLLTSTALGFEANSPSKAFTPTGEHDTKLTLNKNNTLTLNAPFVFEVTNKLAHEALKLDAKLPAGEPIYLVVNSPGGYINAGLELMNTLNSIDRPIHTITQRSASMGFQLVQNLGDRIILDYGTLMAHKASGGFQGEFPGQLDSRARYWYERIKRLDIAVVERVKKYTLKQYRELYDDEYWCEGQTCVDDGFADRVANVSCAKDMRGEVTKEEASLNFMGHTFSLMVTRSECPLVVGPLKEEIYIDGKPASEFEKELNVEEAESKLMQVYYNKNEIEGYVFE